MTTRREFLWRFGGGLGGVALAQLLAETGALADAPQPRPEFNGGLHHPAKAKRVVQLFMNGGVSQPDTFDYKPALETWHGKPFDPGTGEKVEGVTSVPGHVMKSPFPFQQHGECGRWVSSVFPQLAGMNRRHAAARPGDSRLDARIAGYELAARMQQHAPEALDLARETAATRRAYGLDDPVTADFGRRCLLARRLLERGVRFVQVWSGAGGPTKNWDNHSNIPQELPAIARTVDRPAAALLRDLKARGLLDETLVVWSTEF